MIMNRYLTLTLIVFVSRAFAQTQPNEVGTLDKCAQEFHEGSAEGNSFDRAVFVRKEKELRECLIGKRFPSFAVTDLAGKKYSDADLNGKVVLASSWFIGCAPCVAEIPLLNELNLEFKDKGFLLLSFSTDNVEHLTKFLEAKPITYTIFPNSHELLGKLKTTYGYPTNIFLNKKGEIVEFSTGGALDENGLQLTKEKFRKIIMAELGK